MTAPGVAERPRVGTELVLLNGFTLIHNGLLTTPSLGCRRLLALLALRGGLTRSAAAAVLWSDSTDARARACLRTALWQLGRLEPRAVEVGDDRRLSLSGSVTVDVDSVTGWAARIIHGVPTDADLDRPPDRGGVLLPGWYDDWVEFERERLRQLRLHALEIAAGELEARGRYAMAIQVALESIRLDPLRESAHRTLISVHLSEGNVVEAVRDFRAIRSLLRDELGVDPSPRLRALIAEVGVGSP